MRSIGSTPGMGQGERVRVIGLGLGLGLGSRAAAVLGSDALRWACGAHTIHAVHVHMRRASDEYARSRTELVDVAQLLILEALPEGRRPASSCACGVHAVCSAYAVCMQCICSAHAHAHAHVHVHVHMHACQKMPRLQKPAQREGSPGTASARKCWMVGTGMT